MAFSKQFIQEVKDRVAVSDVVGRRVRLQRRGREYVGLSPFKAEKTPSFTVNDQKQFYHCFSTGKHGSVFDFLMETEGLNFTEAVERLATEAGLTLPQHDPRAAARSAKQADLAEVMQMATAWFQHQLTQPPAQAAREYLQKRGVDAALIEAFGIGYSPAPRTALVEHLTAKKITPAQMVEAGLAIKRDNASHRGGALYDRFRDRIIFPIADMRGRVIAFGGRAMQADAPAKYLNSPETPLFHKGSVLYNFARARQSAYEQNQLLVAEGYMDVVGLARGGFTNAVASLGTAVTETQITQLWRLAPEPVLCMDGDEAGIAAAYRVIDRVLPLLKPGFSLRFAKLPPAKDPDDIIREQGREAMQDIMDNATNLLDMVWERHIATHLWNTPERAAALKKSLRQAISVITDKDVRSLYGQEIAARLDNLLQTPASAQRQGYTPYRRQRAYRPPASRGVLHSSLVRGRDDWSPREMQIVLCVLTHPRLLAHHRDSFEAMAFSDHRLDRLRLEIIDFFDKHAESDSTTGLDKDALTGHLNACGLEAVVARLCAMPLARRLRYLRAESNFDEVVADWLEIVRTHHKLKELADAKTEIEAELEIELGRGDAEAERTLQRLTAIQSEMAALERT